MLTLSVLQGNRAGSVFELDAPRTTIGRAPTNQVVLADAHLSSEHGQIFREADHYIYQDLGSTHGSRLRRGADELILDGSTEATLKDGDQLCLGDPREPVILACRFAVEDNAATADVWVQAKRSLADFAKVEDDVARDTVTAKKLLEITRKLARSGLDLQAVFEGVAQAVFELLPRATHVSVALADEHNRLNTVFGQSRASSTNETVKVSRAVIARVQLERDAFVTPDASSELGGTESIMGLRMVSTIGVPLWDGENIRGVIQVYNRDSSEKFDYPDLDRMVTLAGQAALAIERARLFQRVQQAEEKARRENKYLKIREEERFGGIVGSSTAMEHIFRQIDKVKDTRATVCIEGETGTGKELVARAIHQQGNRKDKLFVAQNCAAVSENLLESELFGHKKGAFTGADHDKKGLFEIADGGTLFLDEVGEMSLPLQAKLLRVLQEGEVRPVGSVTSRKVDVRILCATHRSLDKEVERGAFRQDLYYRLHVYPVRVPSLRERREDVPELARHFLVRYSAEMKKPVGDITEEAMGQLQAYDWPGNIRELENEIQRLVIQAEPGMEVSGDLLSPAIRKVEGLLGRVAPKKGTLKDMMEEVERWLLTVALREHGHNKTKTAETLGMTREGLHKKLSKYNM